MNLSLIPNLLTIFRLLAVIPLVVLLLMGWYREALWLALAAGVSDLADGYLARRFDWMTHFGGVLDPIADKLLLVSATLTLTWLGEFPLWLVLLVIARDLLIVGGGYYYHYRIARIVRAEPSWTSKINTLLLILLVVTILFRLSEVAWWPHFEQALIIAVALTTLASGLQYVFVWSRRARRAKAAD